MHLDQLRAGRPALTQVIGRLDATHRHQYSVRSAETVQLRDLRARLRLDALILPGEVALACGRRSGVMGQQQTIEAQPQKPIDQGQREVAGQAA